MIQSSDTEFNSSMKRIVVTTFLTLVAASGALAQSDEELIEIVRVSTKKVFLDQMSFTVPESFQDSGLSPTDKERILKQLASDSADCLADTTVKYSALYDVPISDMVSSDGTIGPRGDSASEFFRMLNDCIVLAWQAAGVNTEGYFE